MHNDNNLIDRIKDTVYHIYLGIEDGWAYPHHTNYETNFYVRIMNIAQVTRLAYDVYKSFGKLSHKEVNPFSVKPNSRNWDSLGVHGIFVNFPENKN